MKPFLYSLKETAEIAIIAAVAVFLIRGFLIQPFLVSGASMEPNFFSGDYLLIDEVTYRLRPPERGEIVVFRYPQDEKSFFVKRIIGLPGERLKFRNGEIIVFSEKYPNGFTLNESYLPAGAETSGQEVSVNENEYFVLGDNRLRSFDSRNWGKLPQRDIVGLVRLRLWPIDKVLAVERPTY